MLKEDLKDGAYAPYGKSIEDDIWYILSDKNKEKEIKFDYIIENNNNNNIAKNRPYGHHGKEIEIGFWLKILIIIFYLYMKYLVIIS